MFMRYIKCQLLVFLFGGIVGPIFLVVGIAGVPVVGTMFFWMGLAITVIDVAVAIAWAAFGAKSAAKAQMLEAQGVLALARVVGVTETGTRVNNQPLIKLNLQIEGPGLTPFTAQDSVLANFTRSPMITSRTLVALVDPATNDFQIDWNRSALVSGAMPAQFTLSEDGRTYDLTGKVGPLMEIMHILKANGVPMNGAIDIRSNPVVRQQVMDVVRRAAAQQPAPPSPPGYSAPPRYDAPPPGYAAPPPPPPPPPSFVKAPEPSTSQRLQELETLRATGAISDSEYAAKRQQIISDL